MDMMRDIVLFLSLTRAGLALDTKFGAGSKFPLQVPIWDIGSMTSFSHPLSIWPM